MDAWQERTSSGSIAMVADASQHGGNEPPEGLSKLDASLLRSIAEIATKKEHSAELQVLARAMIGVIQAQAEMAQLLSQFMQLVSEENRKKDDS
jgi:hypothetical protein